MGQRLALHLTDRCQLDCQHCLRDPGQKPVDLPLTLIESVLDQGRRIYGIRDVSFTGGEPTLHPQFAEIQDAVASRSMRWDMVSNGLRMRAVCDQLVAVPQRRGAFRSVTLSVDGASERIHDRIRGVGTYKQVMEAVALCHGFGLDFGLQMAVHAVNEAELEDLGLLAANLGAGHVCFTLTQPSGTHHDQDLFLPAPVLKNLRHRVERLAAILKLQVSLAEGHFVEQPFHSCAPFRSEILSVDVQGDLNLCCLHSGIPSGGDVTDSGGHLGSVPLAQAHRNLLAVVFEAQAGRLRELAAGTQEWDHFPCNQCLRAFGRPHWTSSGASGPAAARERWRSPEAVAATKLRVIT